MSEAKVRSVEGSAEKTTKVPPLRFVTAASLFDGHDASINIMRRIIQSTGCEVIHLGHDRSVEEVVNCAIQEDAQAIGQGLSVVPGPGGSVRPLRVRR